MILKPALFLICIGAIVIVGQIREGDNGSRTDTSVIGSRDSETSRLSTDVSMDSVPPDAKKQPIAPLSRTTPRAQSPDATGDIYVTSSIPGAGIVLDDSIVAGKTPLTLRAIPVGRHKIVLQRDGFSAEHSFVLQPDDLLKLHIALQRDTASLKLFTEPPAAMVLMDGGNIGESPLKANGLVTGPHLLRLFKEGYFAIKDTIRIEPGKNELTYTLRPSGHLNVKTVPINAVVFANGSIIDQSERIETAPGPIALLAIAADYDTLRDTIDVAQGKEETIALILKYRFGVVTVDCDPSTAKLMLDGKLYGVTPYANNRMAPGLYSIQISKDMYTTIRDNLHVSKDSVIAKHYTLQPSSAKGRSPQTPQSSAPISLNTFRICAAVASAGFFIASLSNSHQAGEMEKRSNQIRDQSNFIGPSDTEYNRYQGSFMQHKRLQYATCFAALSCGLAFGVTFFIDPHTGDTRRARLSLKQHYPPAPGFEDHYEFQSHPLTNACRRR
jgi:hypothetical protein